MRPLVSGIGSAPHNIAKVLAKPLTKALGSLSTAHIRNTSDMMQRQRLTTSITRSWPVLMSALFTNVPVNGALDAIKKVVDATDDNFLPLPKDQYMRMVTLCMQFGCFKFNGSECVQHNGLAMGSPLSPIGACLYLEDLNGHDFLDIIGPDSE